MAKLNLKNIVGKNKALQEVLTALILQQDAVTWIEDDNGKVLMGNSQEHFNSSFPILAENETTGFVKGNETAVLIANLLTLMLDKEAEKKKLGSEVLNLYQEINVIFNFSEKLSQAIEPELISRLTLEQAIHSLAPQSGIIVLWDELENQLEIKASLGEKLFNKDKIATNAGLLLKIGLNGQSEIIEDITLLKEKGIVEDSVQSLIYAAMKVKHRIMGAIILAGKEKELFSAGHLKLLVTLALQSSSAIESAMLYEKNIREAKEREEAILRIHEVTKKFVPNEFLRSLGKEALTDVKLGDQAEKIVTVLFTDIRDFTTLSEKMTPEENFRFVSSFNARLGPIIRSHGGFINQYLGDSIMAIFPDSAKDALMASIEMQKAVHSLNAERKSDKLPPIKAGIGMHTGPLIMGITGDEQRMDAATISDTVNTAARIESLTKYYKSPLLLSRETLQFINEDHSFHIRFLGNVRLKGKHKLLTIIECFDGDEANVFEKKQLTLPVFREALQAYNEQQFEKSVHLFKALQQVDPDDLTALHFMQNAIKYGEEGIPENWTGAEEMLSK